MSDIIHIVVLCLLSFIHEIVMQVIHIVVQCYSEFNFIIFLGGQFMIMSLKQRKIKCKPENMKLKHSICISFTVNMSYLFVG